MKLSPSEKRVLEVIMDLRHEGLSAPEITNRLIAERAVIGRETVKTHKTNIYKFFEIPENIDNNKKMEFLIRLLDSYQNRKISAHYILIAVRRIISPEMLYFYALMIFFPLFTIIFDDIKILVIYCWSTTLILILRDSYKVVGLLKFLRGKKK